MYLKTLLIACVLNGIGESASDCSCNLNRDGKCAMDNNENKYTKESNVINTEGVFDTVNMVLIEGDTFEMGTNKPVFVADDEGPIRNMTVHSFYLDKYEISNSNFLQFVKETNYKTEAETFGDSFVFGMFLSEEEQKENDEFRAVQVPWWYKIKGIDWQHPEGRHSSSTGKLDHPVVHVSWNDAVEYCKHFHKRLPTEAEWEMACRAGLKQKLYPWGNKLNPKNEHWINIWQGEFPTTNTAEDGYVSTAPVDHYPPNKFGLYNMAGNVWEWTQDSWKGSDEMKVKKGGSYLCHESYCWRYRCAARSQNTKDSSAGNLGFRCAGDLLNAQS